MRAKDATPLGCGEHTSWSAAYGTYAKLAVDAAVTLHTVVIHRMEPAPDVGESVSVALEGCGDWCVQPLRFVLELNVPTVLEDVEVVLVEPCPAYVKHTMSTWALRGRGQHWGDTACGVRARAHDTSWPT